MATSVVSICNRALSRIGAQLITSLSEGTQNAQQCDLLYEPTRDELLQMHDWSFALARQSLSALATTYTGWDYAFQLPSDCLYPIEMIDAAIQSYTIEGDALLTDESSVELLYVKQETDPTSYPALFTEALVLRLAARLAGPVKSSKELEAQLMQEFLFVFDRARGNDEWHRTREPDESWWTSR